MYISICCLYCYDNYIIQYDNSLHEWLVANKISLNEDKTELIFFRKVRSVIPTDIKIKINGKKLYPSKTIKYLGMYLDETLNELPHCV